jgi:leucyl aminopeptidase
VPDCLLPANATDPAVEITAVNPGQLDEVLKSMPPLAATWVATCRYSAAPGEVCLMPAADGSLAGVLVGGGEQGMPGLAAGKLPTVLPAGNYMLGQGFADTALASVAWALGAYRFDRYRDQSAAPRLVLSDRIDGGEVGLVADGIYLARDLINTPANDMGPAELSAAAAQLAGRHGAVFGELVGAALLDEGFPLIHAVGAAAAAGRAPRLIDFTWGKSTQPLVTLVGKGVCFDTGGLDIKPPSGMLIMKKDMGGAASILGLASMIMEANLPVRLRVLIPAVENAVSAAAFRPGDVFVSRKGLSVEIGNTDAEGRLVLADALALASESEPDLLIDLATLTGAARVALGPEVAPFYTYDDTVAGNLAQSCEQVADPLWRMPLWQPYMSMLNSKIADINNVSSGPFAGSVTAALFLSRFVAPGLRWIHGDIYGWNPSAKPGRPFGGEANAIRALFAFIKNRYGT